MAKQTTRERSDLEVRLAARQEANRQARETKVTAADLQHRMDERRAAKAATRGAAPRRRAGVTVSLVLGFAMLAGTGCVALATSSANSTFEATVQTNEQAIGKAKGDLAAIPASDAKAAAAYATKLKAQLATATAKGQQVADLQQQFQTILSSRAHQTTTGGLASAADVAAASHRKQLAPYFVDRALIVTDSSAYAPGSVLPFDDDQIDPRFPWHVSYEADGTTAASPTESKWTLTSMIATETPGVLEATWADTRTSDGDLLAWATASYYTSQKQFGSLRVGQTTLGSTGTLNDQTGN